MRAFAEAWPEKSIVQQLIAQLPWGHNLRVLERIKDRATREWYLRAALEYGWSQKQMIVATAIADYDPRTSTCVIGHGNW
jgi:hypothetical protein